MSNYYSTKNPDVWGKHYWYVLHNFSYNYPINPTSDDKKHALNFILALPTLLPCSLCKHDINNFLIRNKNFLNYVVTSNKALTIFFYDLHNYVNQKLRKGIFKIEDFNQRYTF